MDYREVARRFAEDVKKRLGESVKEIILFGSVARGDYGENSDVDVLIVVEGDAWEAQKKASDVAVDYIIEYGVYVSAKVISVEEFELMKNLNTAFYRNIQREGVLIG